MDARAHGEAPPRLGLALAPAEPPFAWSLISPSSSLVEKWLVVSIHGANAEQQLQRIVVLADIEAWCVMLREPAAVEFGR